MARYKGLQSALQLFPSVNSYNNFSPGFLPTGVELVDRVVEGGGNMLKILPFLRSAQSLYGLSGLGLNPDLWDPESDPYVTPEMIFEGVVNHKFSPNQQAVIEDIILEEDDFVANYGSERGAEFSEWIKARIREKMGLSTDAKMPNLKQIRAVQRQLNTGQFQPEASRPRRIKLEAEGKPVPESKMIKTEDEAREWIRVAQEAIAEAYTQEDGSVSLDLEFLKRQKYLSTGQIKVLDSRAIQQSIARSAYANYLQTGDPATQHAFKVFCTHESNKDFLLRDAAFYAFQARNPGKTFWEWNGGDHQAYQDLCELLPTYVEHGWLEGYSLQNLGRHVPPELQDKHASLVAHLQKEGGGLETLEGMIRSDLFNQFSLHKQYYAFLAHANAKGVRITADIPIGEAHNGPRPALKPTEYLWERRDDKVIPVSNAVPAYNNVTEPQTTEIEQAVHTQHLAAGEGWYDTVAPNYSDLNGRYPSYEEKFRRARNMLTPPTGLIDAMIPAMGRELELVGMEQQQAYEVLKDPPVRHLVRVDAAILYFTGDVARVIPMIEWVKLNKGLVTLDELLKRYSLPLDQSGNLVIGKDGFIDTTKINPDHMRFVWQQPTHLGRETKRGSEIMEMIAEACGVNDEQGLDVVVEILGDNSQKYIDVGRKHGLGNYRAALLTWMSEDNIRGADGLSLLYDTNHDLRGLTHYFEELFDAVRTKYYTAMSQGQHPAELKMLETVMRMANIDAPRPVVAARLGMRDSNNPFEVNDREQANLNWFIMQRDPRRVPPERLDQFVTTWVPAEHQQTFREVWGTYCTQYENGGSSNLNGARDAGRDLQDFIAQSGILQTLSPEERAGNQLDNFVPAVVWYMTKGKDETIPHSQELDQLWVDYKAQWKRGGRVALHQGECDAGEILHNLIHKTNQTQPFEPFDATIPQMAMFLSSGYFGEYHELSHDLDDPTKLTKQQIGNFISALVRGLHLHMEESGAGNVLKWAPDYLNARDRVGRIPRGNVAGLPPEQMKSLLHDAHEQGISLSGGRATTMDENGKPIVPFAERAVPGATQARERRGMRSRVPLHV